MQMSNIYANVFGTVLFEKQLDKIRLVNVNKLTKLSYNVTIIPFFFFNIEKGSIN